MVQFFETSKREVCFKAKILLQSKAFMDRVYIKLCSLLPVMVTSPYERKIVERDTNNRQTNPQIMTRHNGRSTRLRCFVFLSELMLFMRNLMMKQCMKNINALPLPPVQNSKGLHICIGVSNWWLNKLDVSESLI